jgi:hypothetical protein
MEVLLLMLRAKGAGMELIHDVDSNAEAAGAQTNGVLKLIEGLVIISIQLKLEKEVKTGKEVVLERSHKMVKRLVAL